MRALLPLHLSFLEEKESCMIVTVTFKPTKKRQTFFLCIRVYRLAKLMKIFCCEVVAYNYKSILNIDKIKFAKSGLRLSEEHSAGAGLTRIIICYFKCPEKNLLKKNSYKHCNNSNPSLEVLFSC